MLVIYVKCGCDKSFGKKISGKIFMCGKIFASRILMSFKVFHHVFEIMCMVVKIDKLTIEKKTFCATWRKTVENLKRSSKILKRNFFT